MGVLVVAHVVLSCFVQIYIMNYDDDDDDVDDDDDYDDDDDSWDQTNP